MIALFLLLVIAAIVLLITGPMMLAVYTIVGLAGIRPGSRLVGGPTLR